MIQILTENLRVSYEGKRYNVFVKTFRCSDTSVVNKLCIGNIHLWLVFNNGNWRFISDMPLCRALTELLIREIANSLDLKCSDGSIHAAKQVPARTGILLNTILNVVSVEKQLP